MDLSVANLALSKPTSQSSRVDFSPYGVDGIYQTVFEKKPCTHTDNAGEISPWWRVDLGRVEPVSEVYLVNRDCSICEDRLWSIDVRIGMKIVPLVGLISIECSYVSRRTAQF